MAIVRPFKAIRPNSEVADKVVSLPYDVMKRSEAAALAKGNPYSFLHISRAEIDLPEVKNPYDEKVYLKARDNIERFLQEGIFVQEEEPVFYIYKQTMDGRSQAGIVGCVSVDEYKNNIIKKHELTRVEKEKDRINHFDICNANTEPVFLTYREDKRITALVEDAMSDTEPLFEMVTGDGVSHLLWTIRDREKLEFVQQVFQEVPSLYIADGHHRSASACKVGLKRREEHPDYTGEEEFNFFMAVLFPEHDLRVFDYNRVVKDLNGYTEEQLLNKIEEAGFEVEKLGQKASYPDHKHVFTMFLGDSWYRLAAKEAIIPDHLTESLDVSILQNYILHPILGIKDSRVDKRIDFIGGIRGLAELERRVNLDMKVAFAVYPVDVEDLLEVSDMGLIMPPKSTWFEPKLGSGLFLHQL